MATPPEPRKRRPTSAKRTVPSGKREARRKKSGGPNTAVIYGVALCVVPLIGALVFWIVLSKKESGPVRVDADDSKSERFADADQNGEAKPTDTNASKDPNKGSLGQIRAQLPNADDLRMNLPYVTKLSESRYECVIPYAFIKGEPDADALYSFECILHRRPYYKRFRGRELKQSGTIRWNITSRDTRSTVPGGTKESVRISAYKSSTTDGPFARAGTGVVRSVSVPPKKPSKPPAPSVVISDPTIRRFSGKAFEVDFLYKFEPGSRDKYIAFQVLISFPDERIGWKVTAVKLEKSGRFKSRFRLSEKSSSEKPKFAIAVLGSQSGRFGPFLPITKVAHGVVTEVSGDVREFTAYDFDRASVLETERKQQFEGTRVKLHGRVADVFSNVVHLYAAGRPIVCLLERPEPAAAKTGEDLVITGFVLHNGANEITVEECEITGRGDACKLRMKPTVKLTSYEIAQSCRRRHRGIQKQFQDAGNRIFQVTGLLTDVTDNGGVFKGTDADGIPFRLSEFAPPTSKLKAGQVIKVECLISETYADGLPSLLGVRFLGIDRATTPATFRDPKIVTSAELLNRFSAGKPVDSKPHVRVEGVVQETYRDGQFVLLGTGGRSIVCKRPEPPEIELVKGSKYVIDGVVASSTDKQVELDQCWTVSRVR